VVPLGRYRKDIQSHRFVPVISLNQDGSRLTHTYPETTTILRSFYNQLVLAGTHRLHCNSELEDFVRAKFYCPLVVDDGIFIWKMTVKPMCMYTESAKPVSVFQKLLDDYSQQFTSRWVGIMGDSHVPRFVFCATVLF